MTFGDNLIDYSAVQEDVIQGWTDNNIIGSDFNDVLLAQYQGQIIDGGLGNDFLGFVTKDYDLYDPRTAPGAPRDYNTLIGGQGSDTFYVPILKDSLTKITDFNPAEDTLMLSPSQLAEEMSRWDTHDYIQLNSIEVREGGVWAELTSREWGDYGDEHVTTNFYQIVELPDELSIEAVEEAIVIDDKIASVGRGDPRGDDYNYHYFGSEWDPVYTSASEVYGTRWNDYIQGDWTDQTFYPIAGSDR